MASSRELQVLSKFQSLSPARQTEVNDFIDFLISKDKGSRAEALDRLLAVAPALEAAGMAPISEDEIMAEVRAVRQERRLARS